MKLGQAVILKSKFYYNICFTELTYNIIQSHIVHTDECIGMCVYSEAGVICT